MRTKKDLFFRWLPLLVAIVACGLAIYNVFLKNENLTLFIWIILFIHAWTLVFQKIRELDKWQKYFMFKQKECIDLRWSYREMGMYINRLHIPELADLDNRIELEFMDIEAKQELFAPQIGVSPAEYKKLKAEGRI